MLTWDQIDEWEGEDVSRSGVVDPQLERWLAEQRFRNVSTENAFQALWVHLSATLTADQTEQMFDNLVRVMRDEHGSDSAG